MNLYAYVPSLSEVIDRGFLAIPPWELVTNVETLIPQHILKLNANNYKQHGNIWIHHTAKVEDNVQFRGAAIIGANCFIASNAYLRGGIILGANTVVGPSAELKSVICSGHSDFAHLNYVGNSVIGKGVNFEGGSVVANHLNETPGVSIRVKIGNEIIDTKQLKFGALVGDGCNIGVNSVLSPGTILEPNTKVPRLHLVQQTTQ